MSEVLNWINGIGAAGGIVVGTIAALGLVRGAIKEVREAIEKVQWFVSKYKAMAQSPEAKADLEAVSLEVDEALEAVAKLLRRVGMGKAARLLSDAIRPEREREAIKKRLIDENPLLQIEIPK